VCDHHGVQRAAATSGTDAAPPAASTDLGWSWIDTAIVVAVAVATVLVHPLHLLLTKPFWLDEAWVAVLTKAPLTQLPRMSSTAPVGFVALLRLVPGSGLQRGRLVVLGFSVLTAITAYVLARGLPWKQRWLAQFAATVAALVVMLAPFSLARNDLKQYTCDGFCALLLLMLGARAEQQKSRRSLIWLAIAAVIAMPFSSTVLFVAVAVFAGLLVSAMLDRRWRQVVDIVVIGLVTGALQAAYFAAAVVPTLSTKVHTYWDNFYLSGSLQNVLSLVWNRLGLLSHYFAMPPGVFIAFFVLGIVMLVRLRLRALAIAMPLLWLEMAIIGRLERYPFLDLRTSQFLLVSSVFVVALGAVGVVLAVGRLASMVTKPLGMAVAVVVGGALAVSYAVGFVPYLRSLNIPGEDVRTETQAVAAHLRPGDVLLINQSANYGTSYYWPHAKIAFHLDDNSGQHFSTRIVNLPNAIYAPTRYAPAVRESLSQAVARWHAAGPGSRLFILRTHVTMHEEQAWQAALRDFDLVNDEQVIKAGDPLLLFEKPPIGGS
jgi:hypothetical protein